MAATKQQEEEEKEYIREPILDNVEMKKIFVAGIPSDVTDDALKTLFEQTASGTVSECQIVRKEGKKNNFGFVTFETSELVDEALLHRSALQIEGKELDVNRAVPKTNTWVGAHEKTKKLFIANLPKTTKEDELQEYFEKRHPAKYGTIESIQLIKEKNPADGARMEDNKGYGFVFVTSEDMADKMSIQHATFQFGGRKIELKKSVPTGGKKGDEVEVEEQLEVPWEVEVEVVVTVKDMVKDMVKDTVRDMVKDMEMVMAMVIRMVPELVMEEVMINITMVVVLVTVVVVMEVVTEVVSNNNSNNSSVVGEEEEVVLALHLTR